MAQAQTLFDYNIGAASWVRFSTDMPHRSRVCVSSTAPMAVVLKAINLGSVGTGAM
jgi:hypothetical protein